MASGSGSKPSEKEWTLYSQGYSDGAWFARVEGPNIPAGERVRVAPAETLERYEKALQQIDAFMGWDRPDSWKVEKARELARGVLGSSGRPEKETG